MATSIFSKISFKISNKFFVAYTPNFPFQRFVNFPNMMERATFGFLSKIIEKISLAHPPVALL